MFSTLSSCFVRRRERVVQSGTSPPLVHVGRASFMRALLPWLDSRQSFCSTGHTTRRSRKWSELCLCESSSKKANNVNFACWNSVQNCPWQSATVWRRFNSPHMLSVIRDHCFSHANSLYCKIAATLNMCTVLVQVWESFQARQCTRLRRCSLWSLDVQWTFKICARCWNVDITFVHFWLARMYLNKCGFSYFQP